MRIVHNFISVNCFTIKSQYPVHSLEKTLNTAIRLGFGVYFMSDAANGFWAIPMKAEGYNKTGFIPPNGQYIYLRMGQDLKGAAHTYSQFTDTVFGSLLRTQNTFQMPTQ